MGSWIPLEANPEVLTDYLHKLGAIDQFKVVDVWSLDEEYLCFPEQQIVSFLVLFPLDSCDISQISEKSLASSSTGSIYFMKQNIENACGTIALLHSMYNLHEGISNTSLFTSETCPLKRFYNQTHAMNSEERGDALNFDEEICTFHQLASRQGQTQVPNDVEIENVDLHFVALIYHKGHIYELDGRQSSPALRCLSTLQNFAKSAANIIRREYFDKYPLESRFSVLAVVKDSDT